MTTSKGRVARSLKALRPSTTRASIPSVEIGSCQGMAVARSMGNPARQSSTGVAIQGRNPHLVQQPVMEVVPIRTTERAALPATKDYHQLDVQDGIGEDPEQQVGILVRERVDGQNRKEGPQHQRTAVTKKVTGPREVEGQHGRQPPPEQGRLAAKFHPALPAGGRRSRGTGR